MKLGFEIRSVCLELWILTIEAEVNSVSMLMAVSRNSSQTYIEKEDSKKLKQKQRERMQPKMGKMDIDYQVLHDAFFKHQTKPKLTSHGDLYYEGKEFEVKLREIKPGTFSQELKKALGMPEGAPPPWLINMQRYGPPPSYPQLKIAGLNAPIPAGAKFGYGHHDRGKPPVDEYGRPLYGDVFGVLQQDMPIYEEPLTRNFPANSRIIGISKHSPNMVDVGNFVNDTSDDTHLVFVVGM